MSQSNYTFRELCELIQVDPKTVRKWMTQAIPPISPEIDKRDGRVLRIASKDVQRLIKEHGISLENPRSKAALNMVASDILTELQERIEHLEQIVAGLQGQLAAMSASAAHRRASGETPASRREPGHATRPHKIAEEIPAGLLAVTAYSKTHGIPMGTINNAVLRGKLHLVKEDHNLDGRIVSNWMDSAAHAEAFASWHQRDDFTPCPECPQQS